MDIRPCDEFVTRSDMQGIQQAVCTRLGFEFFGCDPNHKVGISLNVREGVRP